MPPKSKKTAEKPKNNNMASIWKYKKYIAAILIGVFLSVFVFFLSLISHPAIKRQESIPLDDFSSVLDSVSLGAANAIIDPDYHFIVQAGDAQLYISGINSKVEVLSFSFQEALPEDTTYQLFYSVNGSGLSESRSIKGSTQENTDCITIVLPDELYYDYFRLDIDRNYQLKDIRIPSEASKININTSFISAVFGGKVSFPALQFVLCFLIMTGQILLIAWKMDSIKEWLKKLHSTAISNQSEIIKSSILLISCLLISIFAWELTYAFGLFVAKTGYSLFCFILLGVSIGVMIIIRRQLGEHPERGFFIIALCFGLLFAVLEPESMLLTWDDEIHYARSLGLSYGNAQYLNTAEKEIVERSTSNQVTLSNKQSLSAYLNRLNSEENAQYYSSYEVTSYYTLASYLPAGGAIWLTRLLGFPFSWTVVAGRIGNLLCYVLVIYFSIKQLKHGKLFLSVLALLPTVLFLAANYSYDPFCIAFTILGTCIWLGTYQDPNGEMTCQKTIMMLAAFVIGILTKAIYFPFMLIALFLPNSKFNSRKEANRYRVSVVLATLFVLSSFAVPFLQGNTSADTRGGETVSTMSQTQFILQDPIRYLQILMEFLFTKYLTYDFIMNQSGGCVRAFAYLSMQGYVFPLLNANLLLCLIAISWVVSADRRDKALLKPAIPIKLLSVLLAFGTICLAATSMYIIFTPVGLNTINGCQERYMLPVVLPMLLIVQPTILIKKLPKNIFNAAILGFAGVILLDGIWSFILIYL
ncbi:MAG: DUF2142 domain-containing protein [Clostridia bacterium]|nr:DUF2142 domain-containing protein [Clostridia bacterium]